MLYRFMDNLSSNTDLNGTGKNTEEQDGYLYKSCKLLFEC